MATTPPPTPPDPREQLAANVAELVAKMSEAVAAGVPEGEVVTIVMRTLQQELAAAARDA